MLALVVLAASASFGQPTAYTVGAGDVLEVRVFGEADLSRTVPVAEDGTIAFPLLGIVPVGDLSVREIEKLLREKLSDGYLVGPHVTVTVAEYHSRKVYVLGAVKDPGFFVLSGPTTVLEILSRAGGVLPEGGKSIVLVKGAATTEAPVEGVEPQPVDAADATVVIDGYKLLQEGDTSQNHYLSNLDVVYVPKAREVFVIGEVKKPGAVVFTENLTLLQAIGQAGGNDRTGLAGGCSSCAWWTGRRRTRSSTWATSWTTAHGTFRCGRTT